MGHRITLSPSWAVVTFIYLFGDVLRICHGTVAKSKVSREFNQYVWLWILVLILIPILMVFLTLALSQPASRWVNMINAIFFFLFNLVGMPTYTSLYDKLLIAIGTFSTEWRSGMP